MTDVKIVVSLAVAPASRPNIVVEKVAPIVNLFAPSLPVAKSIRGNVSDGEVEMRTAFGGRQRKLMDSFKFL